MVEAGRYRSARQVLAPLLKPDALDWKPWFWSGTAELMTGRLEQAAEELDQALARDGRVVAVWVQRALVAQQLGRYAVALQLLRVAERLDPEAPQVLLNIGYTFDAIGERKEATRYYQRYLVRTSGVAGSWRARKAVLARLAAINR